MLKTLILQSASTGFLFHWLISDGLYWKDNPAMQAAAYCLFILNMLGIAWSYTLMMRNKQISEAMNQFDHYSPIEGVYDLAEAKPLELKSKTGPLRVRSSDPPIKTNDS
jgi:hypothetical protein